MMPTQKKISRTKWLVLFGFLIFFVVGILGAITVAPKNAHAQFGGITAGAPIQPVTEVGDELKLSIWQKIWNSAQKAIKTASDVVFKNLLTNYVNNYAYNVAVKVATGKSGQKPLIVPQPSELLNQTADIAAGDFLDTLARDIVGGTCNSDSTKRCTKDADCAPILGPTQQDTATGTEFQTVIEYGYCIPSSFSLCDKTNYQLKAKLQGWARAYYEGRPASITSLCPLSTIIDNVQATQHQKLIELSKSFNPEANEIGMYGTILNNLMGNVSAAVTGETFQKLLEGEFEPVTTAISKVTKTPASVVEGLVKEIPSATIQSALTYTGTSLADIGASGLKVFGNTLASKLIEKLFSTKPGGGLNPSASTPGGSLGGSTPGVAAAKLQYASFKETNYTTGGDVDVLSELASCMDKSDPTPTDCVIDNNFQSAIEQQLTVREALDQGLLNGSKIFGYDANGREPDYLSGYPYRSLVILRKYRVIPVGWELAAKYIKQYEGGNYSLSVLISEYDNPVSPFYHLVDPNWVLKMPGVFCKKQGAGEKIDSSQVTRGEDTNYDGRVDNNDIGTTSIQREDYCADEQTCVAEKDDGSCSRFGYCIEEKPIYKFSGTACQAQNNTCQTFSRRSGETVSYLKNSLTYNSCNANNAGCGWYCQNYNPATGQWQCANVPPVILASGQPDKINFTQKVESCQASAEGCHEYIAMSGSGMNLLINSDFESFRDDAVNSSDGVKDSNQPDAFTGWLDDGNTAPNSPCSLRMEAVSDAFGGATAAKLKNYAPDCPDNYIESSAIDTGYPVNQRLFTISLYAKKDTAANNADCANPKSLVVRLQRGAEAAQEVGRITLTGGWTRYTGSKLFAAGSADNHVTLSIGRDDNANIGDECDYFIDNVQLEEGSLTDYKTYEDSPKTYIKKAPEYLGCTGNPATDNPSCNNYALTCSTDEVGCQAYTSQTSGEVVTGVVSSPLGCSPNDPTSCDQCPAQFVGCRAYRELAIERAPRRPLRDPVSFIAASGTTCSAAAVGCEEYTNLEAVANGGEGKEYYSLIKQCVNADNPNADTYYTWEGSDEFGYQLKNYKLLSSTDGNPCTNIAAQKDSLGANSWPACVDNLTFDEDGDGTADIHPAAGGAGICDQTIYNLGTNPDCTEFYNQAGQRFYRLRSRLIYASDQCKAYRNTIDGADAIYHMIPGQGVTCSAAQASCREYKGNSGDNVRTIYTTTFESGTVLPWFESVIYSNESVQVGGHSMLVANSARYPNVGTTLGMRADATYSITFWAKAAATDTNITVSVLTNPVIGFSGEARVRSGEWNRYQLGPLYVPRNTDLSSIALRINSDNAFYIDNITIRESTDSLYLIKDSYKECSGWENCDQYVDSNQAVSYLKSFSHLCGPDKVGCEAMMDTQNSSSPLAQDFALNTAVPLTHLTVSADQPVLLVNDPKKYCTAAEKGCQLFGQPIINKDDQVASYTNVFLRNDPDQYLNSLCAYEERGCEEFTTSGGGTSYFKYPGDKTCEYKRVTGQEASGWYQKGTTSGPPDCPVSTGVCAGTCQGGSRNNQSCYADTSCPGGTCQGNVGTLCNSDATCGVGGSCVQTNSITPQPVNGFAGICPAEESECSEIRDPEDPALCDPTVPGDCKSYYYLDNTLDKTSCNGIVNRDEGCRLFDDTSNAVLSYSVTKTENSQTPTTCDPTQSGDCAANALIQVRNDRVCGKWLECQTSWQVQDKNGKTEDLCTALAVCDRLDNQTSHCTDLINQSQVNETYNTPAYVDQIKNYSGLVTAGLEWGQRCNNNQNIICSERHCTGLVNNEQVTCDSDATCAAQGAGTCRSSDNECRRCSRDASIYCQSDADCPSNAGTCPDANVATCSDPQIIPGYYPYSAMTEVGLDGASSVGDLIRYGDFGDSSSLANQLLSKWIAFQTATASGPWPTDAPIPTDPLLAAEFSNWHNRRDAIMTIGEEAASGTSGISWGNANLDENNIIIIHTSNTAWSGVSYNLGGTLLANREYTLSFKIKARNQTPAGGEIRARLLYGVGNVDSGTDDGTSRQDLTATQQVQPGTDWQEYVLSPFTTQSINGTTLLEFAANADFGYSAEFYLDDISLKPTLQVQGTSAVPKLLSRSCRMYPESDSPVCNYTDENGTTHRGWYGYCIEHDPANSKYCLNWWPVDLLAGETNTFNITAAGYTGRTPLYYCLASEGNSNPTYAANYCFGRTTGLFTPCNGLDQSSCSGGSCRWESTNTGNNYVVTMGELFTDGEGGTEACCNDGVNCSGNDSQTCDWSSSHARRVSVSNTTNVYEYNVERIWLNWPYDELSGQWNVILPILSQNTVTSGGTICENCGSIEHRLQRTVEGNQIVWSLYPTTCQDHDGGGQCLWMQIRFNASTKRLEEVRLIGEDSTGTPDDAGSMNVHFMLREMCSTIARVATSNENKAWTGRTSQLSTYSVPDLLYRYTQDYAPFGSAVSPDGASPADWTRVDNIGSGPLFVEKRNAETARAGSPYACLTPGGCSGRVCSTNPDNHCATPAEVSSCYTGLNPDSPDDDGYCIGLGSGFCSGNARVFCSGATQEIADSQCQVNGNDYRPCILGGGGASTDMPSTRIDASRVLGLLFARSFGVWIWDSTNGGYNEDAGSPINNIWISRYDGMSVCPGTRTAQSYCANLPGANGFSVGSGNQQGAQTIRVRKAQVVQLSFNVAADLEQLPVQKIVIAWGDSEQEQELQGPFANGPVTVSHFYNNTTNGEVVYIPRIQIEDNWGFCSNTDWNGSTGSDRQKSCNDTAARWISTNLTIRVLP